MKKKDLLKHKSKSIAQLEKVREEFVSQLVKLRMETGLGKEKNVHAIRFKRKDLAQILTLINLKKANLPLKKKSEGEGKEKK
ncbi:50S ribosomal protein L29 [Patescibacteria group bacterium]